MEDIFLRDETRPSHGKYIEDKKIGNKLAPLAGYWLLHLPKGEQFAETILSKGYKSLGKKTQSYMGIRLF